MSRDRRARVVIVITTELLHYGYLFIILGTVVEGDATLLTAAFLAHRGYFRLSWVLIAAGLSTTVASQVYYLVARRAGDRVLGRLGGNAQRFARIAAWSRRRSGMLMVASRFMIGFRTLVPLACGATGVPVGQFALWNAVGAALWAMTFGFAGYLGGHALAILIEDIRMHEKALAALVAISTAALILVKSRGTDLRDLGLVRAAFLSRKRAAKPDDGAMRG